MVYIPQVTELGQGKGLYPRLDLTSSRSLQTIAVTTAETAELDTQLDQGSGTLHLWFSTVSPLQLQISQYGTSGASAGAGLPAVANWPWLRQATFPAGVGHQYFALPITPQTRYFRLRASGNGTVNWVVDRPPPQGTPDEALLAAIAAAGESIYNWWEPRASKVALLAGNIQRMIDVRDTSIASPTYAPQDQGTAANQPQWSAAGGPGGSPRVVSQDANRRLLAAGLTDAGAGNRAGIYALFQGVNAGVFRYVFAIHNNLGQVAGRLNVNPAGSYFWEAVTQGGTNENFVMTSPAYAAAFKLFALRPLATGRSIEMDGTAVTPNLATADTTRALFDCYLGSLNNTGLNLASFMITSSASDAVNTAVKNYYLDQFGHATA